MARRCMTLLGIPIFFGVLILVGAVRPAAADTFTFDFVNCATIISPVPGTCPGDTGTPTLTYTDTGPGTQFITATGYSDLGPGDPLTPLNNLYVKTAGPGETGLGLSDQAHNEIQPGTFIQLDTSLFAPGATASLMISSIQDGESYMVCEGDTPGLFGTVNCVTGTFPPETQAIVGIPFDGANPFVDITALSGDVLIVNELVVVTALEPSTLALFLTGAAGLVLVRKQKKLA